jgi:uncharacterized protein YjcR
MATRYDQKTKDEVVAFVLQHNEEKGRGGQSAAGKKWNLNPITVKSWLEKAGVETPGRGGRKKRKAGRPVRTVAEKIAGAARGARGAKAYRASGSDAVDGVSATLQRMMAIQGQIASLQSEYNKLKGKL